MESANDFLSVRAGILHLDGINVLDVAERYQTPLFVFSEAQIHRNVTSITRAFRHPRITTQVFYASKANSNLAILQSIRQSGINVEVNSGGELYKALKAGFRPEQIIYNGVAKKRHELAEAVEQGIACINVDSAYELERIIEVTRKLERRVRIALRIVPEIDTVLHGGLATGTHSSKFGISSDELEGAYRRALEYPDLLDLVGLHMHVGAQITDPEAYGAGVKSLVTTALRLAEATGTRVETLNIGGGLPVEYLKPESSVIQAPDTSTLLKGGPTPEVMAQAAFRALDETAGAEVFRQLIVEPGSRIIADTALLLATVENAKQRPTTGDRWLLLDAGFNTLMDILGYTWYFHAVAAGKADETAQTPYRLGGPLCDSGDVYYDSEGYDRLPDYRLLPSGMTVGDVIALLDTGGYTLEQMNQYNGQPRAAAVLIRRGGEVQIIRQRDSYTDLIAQDVELHD